MNKFIWGLRLAIILACCASIAIVFIYSNSLTEKNYALLHKQTETLSRMVVRQAAQIAYEAIRFDNSKGLKKLAQRLENEKYIFDVTIYDREGNHLISSNNSSAVTEVAGLNQNHAIVSVGRHQFVEAIAVNGDFLGFLRVTLEHNKIVKDAANQFHQTQDSMHKLLLVAIVTGAILMLNLSKYITLWFAPHLVHITQASKHK